MRKKYLIKAPSLDKQINQEYSSFINSSWGRNTTAAIKPKQAHSSIRLSTEPDLPHNTTTLLHPRKENHGRPTLSKGSRQAKPTRRSKPALSRAQHPISHSQSKENLALTLAFTKSDFPLHPQPTRLSENAAPRKAWAVVRQSESGKGRESEGASKGKQAPRPTVEKNRLSSPSQKYLGNAQFTADREKKSGRRVCVTEANEQEWEVGTTMLGKGTFGKVYRARFKGRTVAVKRIEQDRRYQTREVEMVEKLRSAWVVEVLGVRRRADGPMERIDIAMEAYPSNFYETIKRGKLAALDVKLYAYQILRGVGYLHSEGVCHRDLKPHNMLVRGSQLVLCDFGSAKALRQGQANISYICSRCYRAPELIFEATGYSTKIDMWSVGCVLGEAVKGRPLFVADCSLNHMLEVIKALGTPSKQQVLAMNPDYDIEDYDLPHVPPTPLEDLVPTQDPLLLDLLSQLLQFSPTQRLSAPQALAHPYFDQLRQRSTFLALPDFPSRQGLFDFAPKEAGGLEKKLVPAWWALA